MRVAICGQKGDGATRMRGIRVAHVLNVAFLPLDRNIHHYFTKQKWDVIILIKLDRGPSQSLRQHCHRFIFDAIDSWEVYEQNSQPQPEAYWRDCLKRLNFNDIIATTPSGMESMRANLPETVGVHCSPHHCDVNPDPSWYNSNGPIVYSGDLKYLGNQIEPIRQGCRAIGKEFKTGPYVQALRGGCMALSLRLPPLDSPLNRLAKPQIKLANAAAVGMPVLASRHPCTTSLHPDIPTVDGVPESWAEPIKQALHSPKLVNPIRIEEHVAFLRKLLSI